MTVVAMDPLLGTVKHHVRHLVVVTADVQWPAYLADGNDLASTLLNELEASASSRSLLPIKVTAATSRFGRTLPAAGDVLVFPDMVLHRGVRKEHARALVARYAERGARGVIQQVPEEGPPPAEVLAGKHLLVCVHGDRDERCGAAGPALLDALAVELGAQGLTDVNLYASSHVGGHKFAGCLLAFPTGDWYGRVAASHASEIVRECVVAERVLTAHWRGRAGLAPESQTAAAQAWGAA